VPSSVPIFVAAAELTNHKKNMIRSNSRCGKPHKNQSFISLADGEQVKIQVKSAEAKSKAL